MESNENIMSIPKENNVMYELASTLSPTQKTQYTKSTTNNDAPRCMMVKLWHALLLLQNFMGTEWQIWNMKQWPTTASQY